MLRIAGYDNSSETQRLMYRVTTSAPCLFAVRVQMNSTTTLQTIYKPDQTKGGFPFSEFRRTLDNSRSTFCDRKTYSNLKRSTEASLEHATLK